MTQSCINATVLITLLGFNPFVHDNILMLDYYNLSQSYVSMTLRNYSRIRDINRNPPHFAAVVCVSNLVAEAANLTLLSIMRNLNVCANIRDKFAKFSAIRPAAFSELLYEIHGQAETSIVQIPETANNFAYCQPAKLVSLSILNLLDGTGDASVWACLSVATLLVICLTNLVIKADETGVRLAMHEKSSDMAAISALLSPGIAGENKFTRHSSLFVLWSFICTILCFYYSGVMTTELIKPTPVLRVTRISQIVKQDFSLIFDRSARKDNFKFFVEREFEYSKNTSFNHAKMHKKLLRMVESARVITSESDFVEELATSRKIVTFGGWTGVIKSANLAKEFLAKRMLSKKRRCYVGPNLVYPSNIHYVFTGPDHYILASIFQKIMQSGIYEIWWKEFTGSASSPRVQARSRVCMPTHLHEDFETITPFALGGKMKYVFFLWMTCLAMSMVVFIQETLRKKAIKLIKEIRSICIVIYSFHFKF